MRGLRTVSRIVVAAFLAFAFIAGSALPTLAAGGVTGNVSGSVIDASTKAPIAGASVTAASPSNRQTTTTDAAGHFNFLGLPSDTYNISISRAGYETFTLSGVTVQGDQSVNLDPQPLSKQLQTIGRARSRTSTSVYQPTQTIDAQTISGTRATIATGKTASTDEAALALSVPGVQLTNAGRLTIRGGLSNEIGYQFDGVPYSDAFNSRNQNNGRFNGLGALQVVEGAGDPSQGNVGAGVVNVVVKRGTRPSFGYLDFEGQGPTFNHQFAFEYGWATPDNKFSNYTSFNGQRFVPVATAGGFEQAYFANNYGTSLVKSDDFVNNFVYKFGRDNSSALQVLYQNRLTQQYGDVGGLTNFQQYYLWNPYSLGYGRTSSGAPSAGTCGALAAAGAIQSLLGACSPKVAQPNSLPTVNLTGNGGNDLSYQFFQNKISLLPDTPSVYATPSDPSQTLNAPSQTLKFEYTTTLNPTTFLLLRQYNTRYSQGGENYFTGSTNPTWSFTGGNTTGFYGQITKQFGDKHTVDIGGEYKLLHPIWDGRFPYESYADLLGNYYNNGAGNGPSIADFINPADPTKGISAANACPVKNGCYLFSQLYPNGDPNGKGIGRAPAFGIYFAKTLFREYGAFVRDQWNVSRKLKLDLGLRFDGANLSQGCNPYATDPCGNPSDLDPSFLRGAVVKPTFLEPRTAFAYQFGSNDALRFTYGRSVTFPAAQTFGTPGFTYDSQQYSGVAPLADVAGDPTTWNCGTGLNTSLLRPDKANFDPASLGGRFHCQSYASQLHWLFDRNHDAPDSGNNTPSSYNNFDLSFAHQFPNGSSARLTGFFKRGYSVASAALISQILDPTTGQPVSQIFGESNVGINKTTGVELALATAERPVGLTAYLAATYTNVIQSTPPLIGGEDTTTALVASSSLALGNTYRAGFVSPFTINAGLQYKTRGGFRFNPVLSYDRGYPIGVGNIVSSGASIGGAVINGQYYNIPQTNLDGVTQPGAVDYRGSFGSVTASNYVDPVAPGSYFRPAIAATRGLPETGSAGGFLSRPRLNTNMSFEYTKARNTFGVYLANVLSSRYTEPAINPFWQPVATGVGGPLTGQQASGNPAYRFGYPYNAGGLRNLPSYAYGQNPLIEFPTNPTSVRVYYQLAL